jgi:hypothetical protein
VSLESEIWCVHAQRMTRFRGRILGRVSVGLALTIEECLEPCRLHKTENCMIGRRVEGRF